ncbi:SRPBCC family protein [Rhizophagus irregularis DAOM 181602=DAOM 197198]|nr:SRPBCC family protein [Rhizophagus irregularis DAOM 181602=DAOM 197198]CAB4400219.1 unnamed protein product [Rhizophagus irregularis]CAB5378155.1 unnamed protein product [Rhizophagus irregularis]
MFSLSDFPTTLTSCLSDTLSISLEQTILSYESSYSCNILGIFLIPKDRVCSRTAEYSQPQNKIWNTLVKFGAYPQWRSNVIKVEINPPGHIPPDGFEWKKRDCREEGVHFSGSWTIELEEISGNSTRVTVTEKTSVHNVYLFQD